MSLNVRLEAATKQDGDQSVAWCLPLDLFSQGDTKQESLLSLSEAVQLWFESCIERDILAQALVEVGFRKTEPGHPIPEDASLIKLTNLPTPSDSGSPANSSSK